MVFIDHGNFETHLPRPDLAIPLLVVLPGVGHEIPGSVGTLFRMDNGDLGLAAKQLAEPEVEDIFIQAIHQGATVLINRTSNLVVDQGKPIQCCPIADLIEREFQKTQGNPPEPEPDAVPDLDPEGRPLHDRHFSQEDRDNLMGSFFFPFRSRVEEICNKFLDRFGRCWVLEAHSHPMDLEIEGIEAKPMPLIMLQHEERIAGEEIVTWLRDRQAMYSDIVAHTNRPRRDHGSAFLETGELEMGGILSHCDMPYDPRVRSLRVSVGRERFMLPPLGTIQTTLETGYFVPLFLRHFGASIVRRLGLDRPSLSAGDAMVLQEQYERSCGRPALRCVEEVLDGDVDRDWRIPGRHSPLKSCRDVEHLKGCWIVRLKDERVWETRNGREAATTYLVDKWSGLVVPTAKTIPFKSLNSQ